MAKTQNNSKVYKAEATTIFSFFCILPEMFCIDRYTHTTMFLPKWI